MAAGQSYIPLSQHLTETLCVHVCVYPLVWVHVHALYKCVCPYSHVCAYV